MPELFFAVCPRGLEVVLGQELRALGASSVTPGAGGAQFAGTLATAYAANLHSRIASRVLWRVGAGDYRNEADLYELAHGIAWEREFSPHQSLRVDITANRCPLRSLQFATLRVKDAIVDRARERGGARPSIDRVHPEVQVLAHLNDRSAQLYIDLSGESLFKRGWRADKGEAPIKENLAAALLMLAGWTPQRPLLDPFCGSGTIVIEAACIATARAPGLQRRFGFENLRGFDRKAWTSLQQQARAAINDRAPMQLVGRDISTRVIEIANSNALRAGLGSPLKNRSLVFEAADARVGEPPAQIGMIVTNPPYGEQSSPKSASVQAMVGDVAAQLKRKFAGWQVWLLSSDRKLPQQMRLRESAKTVLFNGALECRLFCFDMVAGSMRRQGAKERGPARPPAEGDAGSA
ncbi:Ribosomal RNA large subunit methyltransferase L [Burkholderiales bacterium]|nr:Ribosomal RNA large subunit methyltransferase L [Burkholderiales bacterium]